MLVLVYRKCSTCLKALKWLEDNHVVFDERPIVEQLQLLATNGMLVKRPLVIDEDYVLACFKESEWAAKML